MTANSQAAKGSHADDAELLALLDEQPMTHRSRLEAHVMDCESCAHRLDRLRVASARVSSLVASIDVPPLNVTNIQRRLAALDSSRPATSIGFAWRAAAAIVVVAGVAAASPLRGWLVNHIQSPTRSAPAVPPIHADTTVPRPAGQSAGAVIWFSAPDAELVIRFVAVPAAGTLDLAQSTDLQASAQIAAGISGEALLILPGELRVSNTPRSTADYRVTVPAGVRSVRLVAGDASRSIVVVRGASEKLRLDASGW